MASSSPKDRYCRRCGAFGYEKKPLKLVVSSQRNILQWFYKNYKFDSDTLAICPSCTSWAKRHQIPYSNRKPGAGPKSVSSIVLWDYKNKCPTLDKDGLPDRTVLPLNRNRDGTFRRKVTQFAAINEVNLEESEPETISFTTHNDQEVILQTPLEKIPSGSRKKIAHVPSRRSSRKTSEFKRQELLSNIELANDDGLEIVPEGNIGRGVRTTQEFKEDEFVCLYKGELISKTEGEQREVQRIADNPEDTVAYVYYFHYQKVDYCIDATNEDGSCGRLINHSSRYPNINVKKYSIAGRPCIYFIARKNIEVGTFLRYDYGDRDPGIWWLLHT